MSPEIQQAIRQAWRDDLASGRVFGENKPTVEDIQWAVCRVVGITHSQLLGPREKQHISLARQVAVYLCDRWCGLGLVRLVRAFRRDHTTLCHARTKISRLLEQNDPEVMGLVHEIMSLVNGVPLDESYPRVAIPSSAGGDCQDSRHQ